jgi:hypothetical protein
MYNTFGYIGVVEFVPFSCDKIFAVCHIMPACKAHKKKIAQEISAKIYPGEVIYFIPPTLPW